MIETTLSAALAAALQILVVLVGIFLSVQAYRGYHRHGSVPMRYLSMGIFLLTVVPAVLVIGLKGLAIASDAETLLLVAVAYLIGLGAIDTAFNRSS